MDSLLLEPVRLSGHFGLVGKVSTLTHSVY